MNHVARAAAELGGQAALARALGVSAPTVAQWIAGTRPVPVERRAEIERVTEGKVTRIDLSPDDWWLIWPELAEKHPERVPKDREAA